MCKTNPEAMLIKLQILSYIFLFLITSCSTTTKESPTENENFCESHPVLSSFIPRSIINFFDNSKKCKHPLRFSTHPKRPDFQETTAPSNMKLIRYWRGNPAYISNRGKIIDIYNENKEAISYLKSIKNLDSFKYHLIIVPGYAEKHQEEIVNIRMKERLDAAVYAFKNSNIPLLLLSGGNVSPNGTRFNEAMEMKRILLIKYKIPEHHIIIEPYARNSITNLRNAGRFMLSYNLKKAIIITSPAQNIYFGMSEESSFKQRSITLLGYEVGDIILLSKYTSEFKPSSKVVRKGNDFKDP